MQVKSYGVVRCNKCDQDITHQAQAYDYLDKEKRYRVAYCMDCNYKIKDSYYE